MPTRIQLRDPEPPSTTRPGSPSEASNSVDGETPSQARNTAQVGFTPADKSSAAASAALDGEESAGSKSFRIRDEFAHISATDIVASPRLTGYIFCFTSSIVLMVSSIMFWDRSIVEAGEGSDLLKDSDLSSFLDDDRFLFTATHSILKYKLYSAIAWGAAGILYNMLIVLIHFDKKCLPGVWSYIFKDGSKGERNLLFFLLFFWAVGVFMCTSAYSVGNEQINVYFSSWICLGTTFVTYESWREGAELTSVYDKLRLHPRKTTFKWAMTLFFSAITVFSVIDYHLEWLAYDVPTENSIYPVAEIPTRSWIIAYSLTGSMLLICCSMLLVNLKMMKPFGVKWRHIELFFILSVVGVSAYLVLDYTGVDGYVNNPANPYFGMWGMLLSSMFMIGDWFEGQKSFSKEKESASSTAMKSSNSTSGSEQQPLEETKSSQPQT